MKVAVTGGAGFIGSNLCDRLLARGDAVLAIDNFHDYYSPDRKRANLAHLADHERFALAELDITDDAALRAALVDFAPEAVAHLAAMSSVRYSVKRPQLYGATNVAGTINVLDGAVAAGARRVVLASTSSVYGQTREIPFVETQPTDAPLAPYPATKKATEVMGHAFHNIHDLQVTVLRFFNVYGPRGRPDMMPYKVLDALVAGTPITLYDAGKMQRDWTYVDDICDGVLAASERDLGYRILNLGRGEPVWMHDFVRIAEQLTGRQAIIEVCAAPPSEPKVTYADISQAREHLGYDPQVSIEEGLRRFWEWHQQQ